MGKNKVPVVIQRKDKRLHKGLHLFAFMATGGASGVVTATKAATNAGYNARTRKLAAEAAETTQVTETEVNETEVDLLALSLKEMLATLKEMTTEQLTEVVTMPSGRIYNYWRDGSTITAKERQVLGAAKRELARRSQ